jgi:hypothetical protein
MHQTTDLNDGYLGSGVILRKAIKKYGLAAFSKEILFVFDNEEDMRAKEVELVSETMVVNSDTYNLTKGGKGGFYYINSNGLGLRTGSTLSLESRDKIRQKKIGTKASIETKEKLRQSSIKNNTIKHTYASKRLPKNAGHKQAISNSVISYYENNLEACVQRDLNLARARTLSDHSDVVWKDNISKGLKTAWNSGKRKKPEFNYTAIQKDIDAKILKKKDIYLKHGITKNQFDQAVKMKYIVLMAL